MSRMIRAMSAKRNRPADIKRIIECPVCREDYNHMTQIPKSLLCGHTVCADCLKNILFDNEIKCPVCEENHASTGSIDDLPTNLSVLSIVDSTCQDCRNAGKTGQCLPGHCNQELCDPCQKSHLQDFHSDCQKAFSALQAEINQLEAYCSDRAGLNRMIDGQNKVIKQVNNSCDLLKGEIEKIRKTTIEEIKGKVQSMSMSFIQWQKNLRKYLEEGKKIVKQSKRFSNSFNEDLYNECDKLRKELEEKSQHMPSFIDCSLNASLRDITTLLPDFLDVSYSTVTRTIGSLNRECSPVGPVMEEYSSYTGQVVHEARQPWDISVSLSTGLIAFTDITALHIVSDQFEASTSYDGEGSTAGKMGCAWGTVISRDNKIFVSDYKGHNIHVIDDSGEHLYQMGSEGDGEGELSEPLGLAMDEDDTLFVCDSGNHRICCFTPDGSFIRHFGSKGDREGHFKSEPWFIAASRLHDKVAVSDDDGNLYIFSHGGDHYITIRTHTPQYNMLTRGLAIDAAGHIIVADDRDGQLLVLDDSLQVVGRMGSGGDHLGQLRRPRGVALTSRGEVLISDYWNQRIHMFSN